MFEEVFRRKKVDFNKLINYGFTAFENEYKIKTSILDGEFILHITIDTRGEASTDLIEKETGYEYTLYKTNAEGAFVGKIRAEIENVLYDIVGKCYNQTIFKTNQANAIINFVKNKYGDEFEYLWEKFPENAVVRRKDNKKWYCAILSCNAKSLGINSDKTVEIIDLRMDKRDKEKILANKSYYPGWHMNKNSWYTILLDGGVSDKEVTERIVESYNLAK